VVVQPSLHERKVEGKDEGHQPHRDKAEDSEEGGDQIEEAADENGDDGIPDDADLLVRREQHGRSSLPAGALRERSKPYLGWTAAESPSLPPGVLGLPTPN